MAYHPRAPGEARLCLIVGIAASLAAVSACSSDEPAQCAFDDVDVAATATNPDGVPYPTQALGLEPHNGAIAGERVPNFAFRGYRGADRSELVTVSLADYHDPDRSRHRLLNLMAPAMWCPNSKRQMGEMAQMAPQLAQEGAVALQVVIDGPSKGQSPTLCDLDAWVQRYEPSFSVVIDSGGRRLRSETLIEGVPWNALIDTRTMEVIHVLVGAPPSYAEYIRAGLEWVSEYPPAE